jgi:hypothetical protein
MSAVGVGCINRKYIMGVPTRITPHFDFAAKACSKKGKKRKLPLRLR